MRREPLMQKIKSPLNPAAAQNITAKCHKAIGITDLAVIIWLALSVCAVKLPVSAQGSVPPLPKQPATSVQSAESEPSDDAASLLIGAGDLLKVSVLGAPESDQEVRVGADGNVDCNFIGPVHLAGLSIHQAQSLIAKKLADGGFYTDPQVAVFEKEYATQGVSVLGEVVKPGVYPMLGSRRLFDALSLAGGTTAKAGKVITITHRNRIEEPITITRSSDPSASGQENVPILPGDTIVVAKAGIVYVVGDVRMPAGVVMENGHMTVLQALSMAQGTNPNAALNKAVVIRNSPTGRQQIPLQLKKILAGKAPDVQVQAEDILFIPNSGAKSAGKRSLEAALQAVIGVAIYHPF
jgi:polysaccharide biosynthesis/export protein